MGGYWDGNEVWRHPLKLGSTQQVRRSGEIVVVDKLTGDCHYRCYGFNSGRVAHYYAAELKQPELQSEDEVDHYTRVVRSEN